VRFYWLALAAPDRRASGVGCPGSSGVGRRAPGVGRRASGEKAKTHGREGPNQCLHIYYGNKIQSAQPIVSPTPAMWFLGSAPAGANREENRLRSNRVENFPR